MKITKINLSLTNRTIILVSLLFFSGVACQLPFHSTSLADIPITQSIGGLKLPEVEAKYRNTSTPELEAEFQQRAATIIRYYANPKSYGNNVIENEKRSYPRAMFDFLAGNRQRAIAFLQEEDKEAKEHAHTDGIDYYYSFTLKGQIRKYFLFGQFLDPAYRQRMYEGAKKWTAKDPLTQPHPIYGMGNQTGNDWNISRRGTWVDPRNTDNLRAMRETSVYLMAEETGNEETRLIYKQKIQRYVWALYNIGMGEWDSEVYHGHTFAPYLNLYDFAKDPEVKRLAKAALDWMSAAAALKYYRGGWGGPVKRDYGSGNAPLNSSAARTFWLYFGDTPLANPNPETDTLFFITSTYRPPLAVVALAHKQFKKPVEILATKPLYENWKPGNDQEPGYWETVFFGHSYQMGSLAGKFADGDVAPFKLMAYNEQRGVDYFVANTGGSWVHQGKNIGDQIGQYKNVLIWLRPATEPFYFQLPKTVKAEVKDNIWFFQFEKTWLAIHPVNLSPYQLVTINDERHNKAYPNEQTFKATPQGETYGGFVLEVGEKETHGSYDNFREKVIRRSRVNLQDLELGKISFRSSLGNRLELTYNLKNFLPILVKDGRLYRWDKNFNLYNSLSQDKAPIYLGWKQGKLRIKAGGYQFETEVSKDRKVIED